MILAGHQKGSFLESGKKKNKGKNPIRKKTHRDGGRKKSPRLVSQRRP